MTAAHSRRTDTGAGLVARHVRTIRLTAALDQTSASRGTTVVIAGDVGTGRSRLAAETPPRRGRGDVGTCGRETS